MNITVVDENVIACNNPKYHIVLTDIGKTVVKCSWDVLPDRQEWERQNGKEEDRISLIKKCHVVYDNLTQTLINSVKKDQTARSTCEETEKKAIQALRDLVDSLGVRRDERGHRKATVFTVDAMSIKALYTLCAGEKIFELCDLDAFIIRLVPFVIHMMVGDLNIILPNMKQTEESDDRLEKTADKKCIAYNYTLNRQSEKKYDSEQRAPQTISFDSTKNTLYICKGTISCRKKSHSIVSVTGILASLSGKPVKINVNYCRNCKLYFIDYSEYKYYQQIYGALLGNYRIQNSQKECDHAHDGLADESVLRTYGYTVNQNDGLTQEERRMILCNLMDRNIISKYRIIEYLQFFINNSRHRANMHSANQKWSDDLQWVRSYRIDNQRHFLIKDIKEFR